ncbi:PEGA domain-containing protein [candidate division KSB1 bacterium]|nr:PEGA domain-containing protein [candidate division KSB1 bacterium]
MKAFIIKLSIAAFTTWGFSAVPSDSSRSDVAVLSVFCETPGMPVFLDGVELGVTPLDSTIIPTGSHEIAVVSPYGAAWSHPPFKRSFVAAPQREYTFTAEFGRTILLNTMPYGARVYADSRLLGTTPLIVNSEYKSVIVFLQGYDSLMVDLSTVQSPGILVTLHPNKQWVIEKKTNEFQKRKVIKNRKRLMFTSLGIAFVSGLATVHFRDRGNEIYAQYQSTALPEQMDNFYHRAEKYDVYAGLSYAIFEMSFVLTGYFFLASRF